VGEREAMNGWIIIGLYIHLLRWIEIDLVIGAVLYSHGLDFGYCLLLARHYTVLDFRLSLSRTDVDVPRKPLAGGGVELWI